MKSWFSITNLSADTAEIDIFDEIGGWGISARDFVDQLRAAGSFKNITVNLDSPGGDCNDGFTIFDAIKACQATVTVNITGLAASMASVIMLAAAPGKIRIAENGRVMIHRVTGGAYGNTDDLDAAARVTRQFEERIVTLYTARTGKSEADIRELMKAQLGTWFFGQEAVDAGFADTIIAGAKASAFKPEWASLFTMLPAALFDTREVTSPKSRPQNKPQMTPLRSALITALSLTDPADKPLTDAQIMSSFVTALGDVSAIVTARDTAVTNLATVTGERDTQKITSTNLQTSLTAAQGAEKIAKDHHAALITNLKAGLSLTGEQITALATDPKVLTTAIETTAMNKAIAIAASQGVPPVLKDWNKETGDKTMTVAAFNQLTHVARNEFIRAGGKLTD